MTPGQQQLLYTLACVVSRKNICRITATSTARVTDDSKSGDTYSRMRPEWQQLKEARHRKQIIITRLENWIGEGKPVADEADKYFG